MGAYDSRHTGSITITPPLTWAQIKNTTRRGLRDLCLITDETAEDTPTGRTVTITAAAIAPVTSEAYSGYAIEKTLQSVIDAFPANVFAGSIEARPEDPDGTPWRFIVRDRTVVRQEARHEWHDAN